MKGDNEFDWIPAWKAALQKHVLRGDYRSGLRLARKTLRKHPDLFDVRFQYAKLLGDWADELPPRRRRKYKAEAIRILRPLTRALRGRAPEERFPVSLNYYYQSEDFAGMVRFGARYVRIGGRRGYYAQGLGAAYRAFELHRSGRTAQARRWARRSVRAWNRFDLSREKYYFPHYSLSMALAIAGEPTAARKRLERAARLSGRPITDWEFADVLALCRNALD